MTKHFARKKKLICCGDIVYTHPITIPYPNHKACAFANILKESCFLFGCQRALVRCLPSI